MSSHNLLFVDDEQGVLNALERLFYDDDYHIETAERGKEALAKMNSTEFSLIISDQRMPEMTGSEFLQKAKELSPDTIRIMLTGHSDIKDAVAAINKGEVYKYINKPWDDEELKTIVKQALKQYDLIVENRELHVLVKEQNEALKDINENLKQTVEKRTHEIEEKRKELEQNFIASIRVLAEILSHYDAFLGDHNKRVSALAVKLAESINLPENQVLEIEIAALLHDIGAIAIPKRVFSRESSELSNTELLQLQRHPVIGQEALSPIDKLHNVGVIIKHHHERYDGKGYPDGLKGEGIPIESRIIAVVDSYDLRANARGYVQNASPKLAANELLKQRGSSFDPELVNRFLDLFKKIKVSQADEMALPLSELKEGMKLSRDLLTKGGVLLLEKGTIVQEKDLVRIHNFHTNDPIIDNIYIHKPGQEDSNPQEQIA